MSTECSRPAWFIELERDLNASDTVPDGAAIDWDRCRDLFLIPLLQRLESRSNSPHPAIVRGLLEQRLTGEDVEAKLKATTAAATTAAAAYLFAASATASAAYAAASAAYAAAAAAAAATTTAAAAAYAFAAAAAAAAATTTAAAAAERADQLADLQAALAASTQQPALPGNYIVDLASPAEVQP
jgi:hypothetical protein